MRVVSYDRIYQGVYDYTWGGAARWLWLWMTGRLRSTERLERRAAIRNFVRQQRELRAAKSGWAAGGTGGPRGPRRARLQPAAD